MTTGSYVWSWSLRVVSILVEEAAAKAFSRNVDGAATANLKAVWAQWAESFCPLTLCEGDSNETHGADIRAAVQPQTWPASSLGIIDAILRARISRRSALGV